MPRALSPTLLRLSLSTLVLGACVQRERALCVKGLCASPGLCARRGRWSRAAARSTRDRLQAFARLCSRIGGHAPSVARCRGRGKAASLRATHRLASSSPRESRRRASLRVASFARHFASRAIRASLRLARRSASSRFVSSRASRVRRRQPACAL